MDPKTRVAAGLTQHTPCSVLLPPKAAYKLLDKSRAGTDGSPLGNLTREACSPPQQTPPQLNCQEHVKGHAIGHQGRPLENWVVLL